MRPLFALDTETTGLHAKDGDRIVEIGIYEICNTNDARALHLHFNPDGRVIPDNVVAIHGLTNTFLADKPLFHDCIEQIVDFIGDGDLVIHNAPFDMGFLEAEFERANAGMPAWTVIDTLKLAIREFPRSRHTLDALCRRFHIDLAVREKHGALTDAKLLAELYQKWKGQSALDLAPADTAGNTATHDKQAPAGEDFAHSDKTGLGSEKNFSTNNPIVVADTFPQGFQFSTRTIPFGPAEDSRIFRTGI